MSAYCRAWPLRFLAIFMLAMAFMGAGFSTPVSAQATTASVAPAGPKAKGNVVHIYLLRGLFNVFSTGMDGIRDKLKQRHLNATVHSHLFWSMLADEAIDDYRFGRVDKIIIMGHSAGATNAVDMANKIGDAGVPVALVVALDPSMRATVTSNNVRWVVNLFLPSGMYGLRVNQAPNYTGKVENIGLTGALIDHVTLDKDGGIQDRSIGYALRALKGGVAATAVPGTPVRKKLANPKEAAAPRQ